MAAALSLVHDHAAPPPSRMLTDITQHEIVALDTRHNLADAHTHQQQSPDQHLIIESLPRLWYTSERATQRESEACFIDTFFTVHRQETARRLHRSLLFYAASISTVAVATYLSRNKLSVSLIEPCFDNLHDLLHTMGVELDPIPEAALADVDSLYDELSKTVKTDAVFLVDPNNPTGSSLLTHGERGFGEVIRFCKDFGKVLIVDFCFAAFALMDERLGRFDVYRMLEESGVTYMAIEDTGKIWPLQDMKCSILMTSKDIHRAVYEIQTAILLNVSPFILNVVTQYMLSSAADGFASVRDLLRRNVSITKEAFRGTCLEVVRAPVGVSVGWIKILDPEISATDLQRSLVKHGVYVLPGIHFYWRNRERGEKHFRIAYARDSSSFAAGVSVIRELVSR